jgi:hypothetical protein
MMSRTKRKERDADEPSMAMALYLSGMSGLKLSEPVVMGLMPRVRIRTPQG